MDVFFFQNEKVCIWSVHKSDYRNWCNEIQLNLACAQKSRCTKPNDLTQKILFKEKKMRKSKKKEKKNTQHKSIMFFD